MSSVRSSLPVIQTVRELQACADRARAEGLRIGLVPTMGALHEGHLSLVKRARERADVVWISIFVNPAQFNEAADFETYPQDLERDLALCKEAGVDLVFSPKPEELYPEGAQTWVDVEALSLPLCGANRPGHFRGVTTVVSKLFHAARPHVAVFGEKDFQQLAVIRCMEHDLGFGIEILGGPIVRESDGLALSSRNVRLGPEARQQALVLVRALDFAQAAVGRGECDRHALQGGVEKIIREAPLASIDYVELRDPDSLELAPPTLEQPTLLALAVSFAPDPDGRGADVRLIDNRVLLPQPRS
jgi:pantoate--beta-alanine ligase